MDDAVARLRARADRLVFRSDADSASLCSDIRAVLDRLARAEERLQRLELTADYILDGMAINAPDYELDPEDDFMDAANSEWVRDVLERLAAALRGKEG